MKRLTKRRPDNGLAYLAKVKQTEQDVDSPYPNTLRAILECFQRLAAYEDTDLTPEEIDKMKHTRFRYLLAHPEKLDEIEPPCAGFYIAYDMAGKPHKTFHEALKATLAWLSDSVESELAEAEKERREINDIT